MYTISEIAEKIEIPESTVRFYRNKFKQWVPEVGEGRKKRYTEKSVEVLDFIATQMRQTNRTQDEIEAALSLRYGVLVEAETQRSSNATAILNETMRLSIREEMQAVIKPLVEENEHLRGMLEDRIAQRDRLLMEALREIQETRQTPRKRGIFSLFWRGKDV